MKLIDANVILRYILNDIKEQAEQAEKIINEGAFTLPEIIAEVVYVLSKGYDVPREDISSLVTPVLDEIGIEHKDVIREALKLYSDENLDFVDCIIISRNSVYNEEVFSFDAKLNKNLKAKA